MLYIFHICSVWLGITFSDSICHYFCLRSCFFVCNGYLFIAVNTWSQIYVFLWFLIFFYVFVQFNQFFSFLTNLRICFNISQFFMVFMVFVVCEIAIANGVVNMFLVILLLIANSKKDQTFSRKFCLYVVNLLLITNNIASGMFVLLNCVSFLLIFAKIR